MIIEFGQRSFVTHTTGLKERIEKAEKEIQMREIKYRQAITDKDGTFRWHYWGYLHVDTAGLPVFINPLGPVEWDKRPSYQFTGLKDNNVEVYKSDIIKGLHKTYKEEIVAEVVWDEKSFGWGVQMDGWIMGFECLVNCYDLEIIGNIYQNAKLMEQK